MGFLSGQVPRRSRCVSEGDGEGPLQPSDGEGKVSVGLGHAGWGFAPELLPEAAQGQGAGIARGQQHRAAASARLSGQLALGAGGHSELPSNVLPPELTLSGVHWGRVMTSSQALASPILLD